MSKKEPITIMTSSQHIQDLVNDLLYPFYTYRVIITYWDQRIMENFTDIGKAMTLVVAHINEETDDAPIHNIEIINLREQRKNAANYG